MEFPELNLTKIEADAKVDGLSFTQLKYSFVVLLYVTFRDVVKYVVPLISAYIKQKVESSLKLE